MADRVVVCIGTKKGLFVAEASKKRSDFSLRGPFGPGVAVYAALIDTRGTPRLYASSCNPFFGMKVLRSTDLGKKFKETKSAPAFPKDDGRALANIWSLELDFSRERDGDSAGCGEITLVTGKNLVERAQATGEQPMRVPILRRA